MTEEAGQTKLNVRVPVELKRRLEVARVQRDLEQQEAVWQALEMWLAKEGFKPEEKPRAPDPFPNLTDGERALLQRALEIVRDKPRGDPKLRQLLMLMLGGGH